MITIVFSKVGTFTGVSYSGTFGDRIPPTDVKYSSLFLMSWMTFSSSFFASCCFSVRYMVLLEGLSPSIL